jgi:hypothetical protein
MVHSLRVGKSPVTGRLIGLPLFDFPQVHTPLSPGDVKPSGNLAP